jgi:hypothetical protein
MAARRAKADAEAARAHLDALVTQVAAAARLLPALTVDGAAAERARLIRAVAAGRAPTPRLRYVPREPPREAVRALDEARRVARDSPAAALYLARLDELELELRILAALGDARAVPPLAALRYGRGDARVIGADGAERTLTDEARRMLRTAPEPPEPRTLPADDAHGGPSMARVLREAAAAAGLEVTVRIEPRLAANAATGDRFILLAARDFGVREARRLAVHEVFGHLVSAAHARMQPLRLLEVGTAESFADQEGTALALEERAGVLDANRARTLAARVLATDAVHAGEPFGSCARTLVEEHGLAPDAAVAVCERAYRGGGVARDASYLRGWLRVRRALDAGETTLDELRLGRVSLDALPALHALVAAGHARTFPARPVA